MSVPFIQSKAALHSDNYQVATVATLLATPLLLGWLWWFFAGDISIREMSTQIGRIDDALLLVTFEENVLPDPRLGDDAWLYLETEEGQPAEILPAYISDLSPNRDGTIDVWIYVLPEFIDSGRLPDSFSGWIEIETDEISPALYIWRAAGQDDDAPSVSISR